MQPSSTTYIPITELAGNAPTSLDPLQQILAAHYDAVFTFWIVLWCATAIVLLFHVWKEFKNSRRE